MIQEKFIHVIQTTILQTFAMIFSMSNQAHRMGREPGEDPRNEEISESDLIYARKSVHVLKLFAFINYRR